MRRLKELADELGIRGGDKLYKAARRRGLEGVTTKLAAEAVKGDVGRQVLAPPPRSTGKSAAEGANQRLQADLIDISNNARVESGARFALLFTDVYTREARATPLGSKIALPKLSTEILRPALRGRAATGTRLCPRWWRTTRCSGRTRR